MCRSYTGKVAIACWEEIAYSAFRKFKEEPKAIFDFCSTSPEPEGALLCKRYTLVLKAVSRNFNLEEVKDMCELPQALEPGFEGNCYNNLASILLVTIPNKASRVVDFCSGLNEKFSEDCYGVIGSTLRKNNYDESKIKQICDLSEERYSKICFDSEFENESAYQPPHTQK
jgi:hypothetical protein